MLINDHNRLLARLSDLRGKADDRGRETFAFIEELIDVLRGVTIQRDELRTETEPVRVEQAAQIRTLTTKLLDTAEEVQHLRAIASSDTPRVISLETMQPGDWAYLSKGKRGIDTIDRMRGPVWEDINRGENWRVQRVGTFIRIGDEAHLRLFDGVWQWLKVT